MKLLSVIIVTYFSENYLEECLNSLVENNDLSASHIEIIIVDNSPYLTTSLDNIHKNFRRKFPHVTLISNPQNAGFGQGNNIGAGVASGKILLFLNPDTKFIEPVFLKVVECLSHDDNIGALGCRLLDAHGKPTHSYGFYPEKWNVALSVLDKCIFKPLRFAPNHLVYPWGANLFVRTSDFFAAGAFDENIFLCHEEPDLCSRLSPKRTLIIDKSIVHFEGHSTAADDTKTNAWINSLIIYHEKHGYNLAKSLKRYQLHFSLAVLFRTAIGKEISDLKKILEMIKSKRKSLENNSI